MLNPFMTHLRAPHELAAVAQAALAIRLFGFKAIVENPVKFVSGLRGVAAAIVVVCVPGEFAAVHLTDPRRRVVRFGELARACGSC